jgi:hypothetical protein
MRMTARRALMSTTAIPFLLVGPAAQAQTACSEYAETCVQSNDQQVGSPSQGGTAGQGGTSGGGAGGTNDASGPSTLPFTGGEVALLAAAGLGALGVGTGLVVAGRRRSAVRASSPA